MKAQIPQDKDLISQYLQGNQYSLEKLINRHQNRVFAYILMVVKTNSLPTTFFRIPLLK